MGCVVHPNSEVMGTRQHWKAAALEKEQACYLLALTFSPEVGAEGRESAAGNFLAMNATSFCTCTLSCGMQLCMMGCQVQKSFELVLLKHSPSFFGEG